MVANQQERDAPESLCKGCLQSVGRVLDRSRILHSSLILESRDERSEASEIEVVLVSLSQRRPRQARRHRRVTARHAFRVVMFGDERLYGGWCILRWDQFGCLTKTVLIQGVNLEYLRAMIER